MASPGITFGDLATVEPTTSTTRVVETQTVTPVITPASSDRVDRMEQSRSSELRRDMQVNKDTISSPRPVGQSPGVPTDKTPGVPGPLSK